MTRLQKLKSKLFLHTPLKAVHLLDGAYSAVVKGKSMNFDELREYSRGDSRKDVDWKSSARASQLLVKQYHAEKRVPVDFLFDTGKNMVGVTPSLEEKYDVGLNFLGVMGLVVLKHGDTVGGFWGGEEETQKYPQGGSEPHLARYLDLLETKIGVEKSSIELLLKSFIERNQTRRIVVVVSSTPEITDTITQLVTKIKKRHDLIWCVVEDVNPFLVGEENIYDVESLSLLPRFLKKNKKLAQSFSVEEIERKEKVVNFFHKYRVPYVFLDSNTQIVSKIIDLLQRRLHERR